MTQTNYFGCLSVPDYLSWQMQRKQCKNVQRGNCFHTIPSIFTFILINLLLGSSICQLHFAFMETNLSVFALSTNTRKSAAGDYIHRQQLA